MHTRNYFLFDSDVFAMASRRRWSKLYPVVSLRSVSRYDDVLIKVCNGNPAISAATMRDLLLRGYQINVGVVELEQWINVARSHYASTVFAYDRKIER